MDKAFLILSDGSEITLSSDREGIRIDGGDIAYLNGETIATATKTDSVPLKRLTVASIYCIARQFAGVAECRFLPILSVNFTQGNREVVLSGEAYFDVVSKANQPFIVQSRAQTITVLGTQFNVNAYRNEPAVVTTLVDGTIRLRSPATKAPVVLKPSEQAISAPGGFLVHRRHRAFHRMERRLFLFDNTELTLVLRQLSRWYDVDLALPNIPPGGSTHGLNEIEAVLLYLTRYRKLRGFSSISKKGG